MENIKTIPHENLIDIQISGYFYSRLTNLLYDWMKFVKKEDLEKTLEKIKEGNISHQFKTIGDMYTYHLETLISLCNEIEKCAIQQNKYTEIPLSQLNTK